MISKELVVFGVKNGYRRYRYRAKVTDIKIHSVENCGNADFVTKKNIQK